MNSDAPTIIDLKLSFLRTQIRALSQPVRPSAKFQESLSAEDITLRQKSIDDALQKLDVLLKNHIRLSYGPQAQRHVAEQVDKLYWNSGERGVNIGEEWAERGADYRKETIIESMPEEWSEDAEERAPEQAARYRQLQSKLAELNGRRKAARDRLDQCKAAKILLEPFDGEEAGLQDNIITKNGELEKELERMRMLMLRVERGIAGLDKSDAAEEMDVDIDESEEKKIQTLLSG